MGVLKQGVGALLAFVVDRWESLEIVERGWEMLESGRFPKLISLIEAGQRIQQGVIGSAIRAEFENVKKARELGYSWDSIAESLGFPGRGKLASANFSRELRRRAKKGVVPEKNGKGVMPASKPILNPEKTEPLKKENRSTVSTREAGITTSLGRGKFQINRETPEDKL